MQIFWAFGKIQMVVDKVFLELTDHSPACHNNFCLAGYARSDWPQPVSCTSQADYYGYFNLNGDCATDHLGNRHVFFYATMGNA